MVPKITIPIQVKKHNPLYYMLKWIARVCEELCVYDKYIDGNKI